LIAIPQLKKFLLIAISTLAIVGCNNQDKGNISIQYFSISNYLNIEIDKLKSQNLQVLKTVELNGNYEEKKTKIENWENELSSFLQAEINKPAFMGKYQVDSLIDDGKLIRLIYTSETDGLKTTLLQISYKNSDVDNIIIKTQTDNFLYRSQQSLFYSSHSGFSIEGTQKIKFLDKNNYEAIVQFNH